jgi:hypothetical protein
LHVPFFPFPEAGLFLQNVKCSFALYKRRPSLEKRKLSLIKRHHIATGCYFGLSKSPFVLSRCFWFIDKRQGRIIERQFVATRCLVEISKSQLRLSKSSCVTAKR